jgi:high-affinity Fe2+/Pb2+ permease
MVDVNMVFSPVAFFIFMRETLEASVIVAVLLQCMNRTMPRLKRWGEHAGAPSQCSQSAVAAGSGSWTSNWDWLGQRKLSADMTADSQGVPP